MTTVAPPAKNRASDHLANERTFLAWIRTSISIIVFGFVVSKFGITLRELLGVRMDGRRESGMSLALGVSFIAAGIFLALASLLRYRRTMKQLIEEDFQPADASVTMLAVFAAFFGFVLSAYLIYTAAQI